MNVLHIGPLPSPDLDLLEDSGHLFYDFRTIQVDDPDDVWGPPIYEGPAYLAFEVLKPGTYHYVYTDEEDWDI